MGPPSSNDLSIAAVERETGLSKDTLRVWERRYKFPTPDRDKLGERTYPPDQVEKLRLIKKLMDHGHRPSKLVGEIPEVLRAMAAQPSEIETPAQRHEERDDLLHYVSLCKTHRIEDLRRELAQALLKMGMYQFVVDVIAPLTSLIGTSWENGHLAVFEEHLYTEAVQAVLRNAVASIPLPTDTHNETGARPRIILTTIPEEQHSLGLLMAHAIFALEGAHCISLGVQTPIAEIAHAARAQAADVVALSFSSSARPARVLEALADLRAELPAATEIWAGGRCAALKRRLPASINVLELQEIPVTMMEWRRRLQALTG